MGCGKSNELAQVVELKKKSRPKFYSTQDQLVVHEARALVFSCMDFRLLDEIVSFMNDVGYNNNYDQFILAGCSLSFINDQFKLWRKTATDHLDLAMKLHHIKEVICIEHAQCGAYKMCYPELKPENEKEIHVQNVIQFEKILSDSHPELKLHAFYMLLDGSVEKIN